MKRKQSNGRFQKETEIKMRKDPKRPKRAKIRSQQKPTQYKHAVAEGTKALSGLQRSHLVEEGGGGIKMQR